MKSPDPRHRQETREQQLEETSHAQAQETRPVTELGSAEELLRYDRAQTPVPEAVAQRVSESVRRQPSAPTPWWRRWI